MRTGSVVSVQSFPVPASMPELVVAPPAPPAVPRGTARRPYAPAPAATPAFIRPDRMRAAGLLRAAQGMAAGRMEKRLRDRIVRLCRDRLAKLIATIQDVTAAMQRHHKETLKASLAARCVFGVSGGPEALEFECGDEPGWEQISALAQAATHMPARLLLAIRRSSAAIATNACARRRTGAPAGASRVARRLLGLASGAAGCQMPA